MTETTSGTGLSPRDRLLFLGCFVALITTAFGFILRTMLINEWGVEFSLTETQKGEILGVGLWPFAISIVVLSLIIDRIGYGRAARVVDQLHGAGILGPADGAKAREVLIGAGQLEEYCR